MDVESIGDDGDVKLYRKKSKSKILSTWDKIASHLDQITSFLYDPELDVIKNYLEGTTIFKIIKKFFVLYFHVGFRQFSCCRK